MTEWKEREVFGFRGGVFPRSTPLQFYFVLGNGFAHTPGIGILGHLSHEVSRFVGEVVQVR
eukprot:3221011-Rhodomonas_salina.3